MSTFTLPETRSNKNMKNADHLVCFLAKQTLKLRQIISHIKKHIEYKRSNFKLSKNIDANPDNTHIYKPQSHILMF